MIIHLSIHTPKPGKVEDLVASIHHFAAAGAGQPGFIEAIRAAVADDPLDEWEGGGTDGFFLQEA